VEVVASDLFHLQPGEFLNDTVMDLRLRQIAESLPAKLRARVHFFNTFFYKKLCQAVARPAKGKEAPAPSPPAPGGLTAAQRVAHDRLKKWTKGVDLFHKDFLFIPVHHGLHWSLAVVCNPGGMLPSALAAALAAAAARAVEDPIVLASDDDAAPAEPPADVHAAADEPMAQPDVPVAAAEAVAAMEDDNPPGLGIDATEDGPPGFPPTARDAAVEEEEGEEEEEEEEAPSRSASPDIGGEGEAAALTTAEAAATAAAAAAKADEPAAAPWAPTDGPFIIHLDSMGGGHSTPAIGSRLRPYLTLEWERLAAKLGTVAHASGEATRLFSPEDVPCKRLTPPQQNNCSDCGCFVLVFIKYFADALGVLKPLRFEDVDTFLLRLQPASARGLRVPGWLRFLGPRWFVPVRGFNTRDELTNFILDLFVTQNSAAATTPEAQTRLARARTALVSGLDAAARADAQATARETRRQARWAEAERRSELPAAERAALEAQTPLEGSDSEEAPGDCAPGGKLVTVGDSTSDVIVMD